MSKCYEILLNEIIFFLQTLFREKKFIAKANKHIQITAQKFTDEAALLKACFFNLEEDIVYHERSSRMHLRRLASCVQCDVICCGIL
jgi:hypothetical protein